MKFIESSVANHTEILITNTVVRFICNDNILIDFKEKIKCWWILSKNRFGSRRLRRCRNTNYTNKFEYAIIWHRSAPSNASMWFFSTVIAKREASLCVIFVIEYFEINVDIIWSARNLTSKLNWKNLTKWVIMRSFKKFSLKFEPEMVFKHFFSNFWTEFGFCAFQTTGRFRSKLGSDNNVSVRACQYDRQWVRTPLKRILSQFLSKSF